VQDTDPTPRYTGPGRLLVFESDRSARIAVTPVEDQVEVPSVRVASETHRATARPANRPGIVDDQPSKARGHRCVHDDRRGVLRAVSPVRAQRPPESGRRRGYGPGHVRPVVPGTPAVRGAAEVRVVALSDSRKLLPHGEQRVPT